MGVTHAWELYGDNEPPDIQAVGNGLSGGYAVLDLFIALSVARSDQGLGMPVSLRCLCLSKSRTAFATRMASGNTVTPTR